MAETLTIKKAVDASSMDVNNVNFDTTTPGQIIAAAVENGFLTPNPGEAYKALGKNNQPVMDEVATLAELGFKDGDTMIVVSKPSGAR